jgi:hypothetical protein
MPPLSRRPPPTASHHFNERLAPESTLCQESSGSRTENACHERRGSTRPSAASSNRSCSSIRGPARLPTQDRPITRDARFLLHAHLLAGTTAQTFYEVAGPTSLAAPMSPYLSVAPANLDAQVCSVLRLDGTENLPSTQFAWSTRPRSHVRVWRQPHRHGVANVPRVVSHRQSLRPHRRLGDRLEAALVSSKKDAEGLSLRLRSRAAEKMQRVLVI